MDATIAAPEPADIEQLVQALDKAVDGEVRFEIGSRALYATDASNYRQVPIGVVIPQHEKDIERAVAVAREFDVPILMRGAGTSLAGQTCNAAVVLDTSKYMNQVLDVDPDRRTAVIQPGVVCDVLRDAAEAHGLTFGPDPSTHTQCTLGGMIGNNSCGAHSVMAGKTDDNIESLDILTYDGVRMTVGPTSEQELEAIIQAGGRKGEIYAGLRNLRDRYAEHVRQGFPDIRRRVSGYNLDALLPENGFNVARALVGSEGTCAITLSARTKLVDSPPHRVLVVLGYEDICRAGDEAPAVLATGPLSVEGLDERIVEDMRKKGWGLEALDGLPEGNGWILSEFGGETVEEATDAAQKAIDSQQGRCVDSRLYTDPKEANRVWSVRKSGSAATNALPGEDESYPGWEDAAVDPARVGDYLRDFRKLLDDYGYRSSLYGHFGDGCIHGRMTFDLSSREGVAKWRRFLDEAADLVVAYGGSLSGEHGDGQARAELWPKMFGPELMEAFRRFKEIWDPRGRLNPHKLIDPYRIDEHLRTGPDHDPLDPQPLHFSFRKDQGSFSQAAHRCVGVGKCRSYASGTMCPSYRGTMEEKHSTRGRARLLFEMLQGDTLEGVWNNNAVHEALDLCLACKACSQECPVQVDMATYKAEFMAHYYEHHRRPRQAWTLGMIHEWARLAGRAPKLFNGLTKLPGTAGLARGLTGMTPERDLPQFSSQPFTRSYRSEPPKDNRPAVVLWPDTFNNFLHSDSLRAAARVLDRLGFEVQLPGRPVCCGRPLYDYGMLERARWRLRQVLETLAPAIEAGIPVVGLEPSCMSTFRDELLNFFPQDERALRLAQNSWLLPDFLVHQDGLDLPHLKGTAWVHGHCHQKSGSGMAGTQSLLEQMGLEAQLPDNGCCGMAGAFGFDGEKYPVSMRIAESAMLPSLRDVASDTYVISDGFSCREQIRHGSGRTALHTAQLLDRAFGD
ncbi:FAD-binding and (Fe-S)-binding domain-containing protein [Marinobacter nanhaiticus D15-8W]|uniref:FAD-binding oxidoreductase n=1 Tax=Marinobacter nanhaiticus D15-8W TaxID=626887 RepID=N6WYY0_9GAMM|nr:FAD-binding and (Fe-S)-binding domain-containing protein [Marinobacter nanhaiticus]ENO16327.1 FAD-binding oxidoreductase [Marinobacter nanhaiticus D15-8W]BES72814.1 FAD-binding and (Fe-S)-binding domain-containing protein [Marinobacter nanhaiticus D15-8W]